jgi:hypothetical protein
MNSVSILVVVAIPMLMVVAERLVRRHLLSSTGNTVRPAFETRELPDRSARELAA